MNFYLHTNDVSLKNVFSKKATLTPINKADIIFIDWMPKYSASNLDDFKHVVKKQKVIVFDRFLSIEMPEAIQLRKIGVVLTEPALNFRRKYFDYIPFWINDKNINDIELNNGERKYDLIFKGDLLSKKQSFVEYYIPYSKLYPKTTYYETTNSIPQTDIDIYSSNGITKRNEIKWSDSKVTLIIGSNLDYDIGYIDYSFIEALNNNCIPLIVNNHKYYSLLSPYRIGYNSFDINYVVNNYNNTYVGYILHTYDHIKKYYPEMIIENVVDKILELSK